MGNLIYQWIDLIWIPVAWFVVHRQHRWYAVALAATCSLTLRTQVELMRSIGHDTGMLHFMNSDIYARGLIAYGVVVGLFLLLSHFSQATAKIVYFAACLSVYIFAFCGTMVLMLL
jgi:hypothetical protein